MGDSVAVGDSRSVPDNVSTDVSPNVGDTVKLPEKLPEKLPVAEKGTCVLDVKNVAVGRTVWVLQNVIWKNKVVR